MSKNNRIAGYKSNGRSAKLEGVFQSIPLDEIHADYVNYQRNPKPEDIARIVDNFDTRLLGQITVTHRKMGNSVRKTFVVDGNHRCCALRALGFNAALCFVIPTSGIEDEAWHFDRLNTQKKKVPAFDLFRSRVTYGERVATEIAEIVTSIPLALSPSKDRYTVAAVNAMEKVHTQYGTLAPTLRVLCRWGNGASTALTGDYIADLGGFFDAYPDAVEGRALSALQRFTPAALRREIATRRAELGCSRPAAARVALKGIYNAKLRPKQRLGAPKGADQ